MKTNLIFVSFEKSDDSYTASLFLQEYGSVRVDPESLLRRAERIYSKSVTVMESEIRAIKNYRSGKTRTPARAIWHLGDSIFKLISDLERLSVQINNLYSHLERDLEVKRKWLEKVVILRRYIDKVEYIPVELNWGQCEKGTRKAALKLTQEALAKGELRGGKSKDGRP